MPRPQSEMVSGRIAYFSRKEEYLPLEQIAGVGMGAVSVYHRLVVDTPENLYRLHKIPVQSRQGEANGWVEDFLFDWQTGEITAYILGGEIATPFGGRAVLYPEDVEEIASDMVIVREDIKDKLYSEPEGLKGFLSEKSQVVFVICPSDSSVREVTIRALTGKFGISG
jgi:uncharacterized protein YrrD